MIAVIQRVNSASISIKKKIISKIKKGLLIFIGIEKSDTIIDIEYIIKKTSNLRIFSDQKKNMNLSVQDIKGEILLVSQFTLCANIKQGRRPSFKNAELPQKAKLLYNNIINKFKDLNLVIETGEFGANMDVKINNNGPVTIIINSKDNDHEN